MSLILWTISSSSDFKRYARINLLQNPASQNISQVPPGAQVKILIHGFQSGPALPFALGAKNGIKNWKSILHFFITKLTRSIFQFSRLISFPFIAYLKETDHSVIVVDWEMLSLPKTKITLFYYPAVTANAMRVGEKVARLIEYLFETGVISDLAQVHVIGHSLGAHGELFTVQNYFLQERLTKCYPWDYLTLFHTFAHLIAAGYAGDLINSRYGAKIGRITGT